RVHTRQRSCRAHIAVSGKPVWICQHGGSYRNFGKRRSSDEGCRIIDLLWVLEKNASASPQDSLSVAAEGGGNAHPRRKVQGPAHPIDAAIGAWSFVDWNDFRVREPLPIVGAVAKIQPVDTADIGAGCGSKVFPAKAGREGDAACELPVVLKIPSLRIVT